MTLTFLTMPLSTNALYGVYQGRKLLSSRGRANKEAIAWEARSQYRGEPVAGPLSVSVALYWPTARNHDIDNLKALFDSLSGIVWEDDQQIVELHIRKTVDRINPRTEITIEANGGGEGGDYH